MSDSLSISRKIFAYVALMKLRLSLLVVFSSVMVYILALDVKLDILKLMLFATGGLLITAAANTFNQLLEVDFDRIMTRTMNRPLPTGMLLKTEASYFGVFTLVAGVLLMKLGSNLLTTLIALLSFVLYVFAYTPMKRISPVAVLIGAIPGALPPLIGWTAIRGSVDIEAWVLFGIQFIWQFPHFWAIAWVLDEDYKKAGFRLLPGDGEKNINTAFQIMIYTLLLLPLGMLPANMGLTGINSAIVATVCGTLFLIQTLYHMKNCTRKSALGIMFGSFIYLPVVQIAYVLDKI
jgi:protoheme IX farnesyltransferase